MTDCGCAKAKESLEEYLRNEICKVEASDIRDHLASCPECADEAKFSLTLTEVVQRACREEAPEDLRSQILGRLRTAQAEHAGS